MSNIIDVLLFEAALFILAVTGCFCYGMYDQLREWKRERQIKELAEMSDEDVLSRYIFSNVFTDYPESLVSAEYWRRRDAKKKPKPGPAHDTNESLFELFNRGVLTTNQSRSIQVVTASGGSTVNATQVSVGSSNVNVVGEGNVVTCSSNGEFEDEIWYADNVAYVVRRPKIPDTYGTDERK